MTISKEQAGEALKDVEALTEKTKRVALFKGADALYMIWGIIWMIAFTLEQFIPHRLIRFGNFTTSSGSLIWLTLSLIGICASIFIFKYRVPVASPEGKRIGIFWGVLFGYFYLWTFLFASLIDWKQGFTPRHHRIFTAVAATVPMFAYVVMGLWGCGNYMIWLGLGVTVLTVVGLFAVPSFFYLWMAVFGGGALFLAGVITRRRWRKA